VTDGQTNGQTDGIAMAYTRYSIYAVARKNTTKTKWRHYSQQTHIPGGRKPNNFSIPEKQMAFGTCKDNFLTYH